MSFDGEHVNLAIAFLAGIIAFASPCVFPLVPAYVGFFGGVAVGQGDAPRGWRGRAFRHSLLFALGFLVVFALLGLTASGFGHLLAVHRTTIARVGGGLLALFGLFLLGAFQWLPATNREVKVHRTTFTRFASLNAFLVGATFGFAWTPCIGPVLAAILFLATEAETALRGMVLLITFGLGIAVPFLIVSLLLDHLARWLRRFSRASQVSQWVAGVLLLVVGLLMVTNAYNPIVGWLLAHITFQPAL